MLKPVINIELKNGYTLAQSDLCIDIGNEENLSEDIEGFLIVTHSGRVFYVNKDMIADIEVKHD